MVDVAFVFQSGTVLTTKGVVNFCFFGMCDQKNRDFAGIRENLKDLELNRS
jgi:hypothetical protein